jgi:hypothetical protein
MSATEIKQLAQNLSLKKGSKHELIRKLIIADFFDTPKSSDDVITEIKQIAGKRLKSSEIHPYMKKFMGADLIRSVQDEGIKGIFWVLANMDKKTAFQFLGKDSKVQKVQHELFSDVLLKKLGSNFEIEFRDLQHNFGESGTCTAFLLRKILEKLIHLAFAKQGLVKKLADKTDPHRLVGLDAMINLAVSEKPGGVPFLTSKTAKEIQGLKFLGDSAAHNPIANVDMKTILPQMPFIITAFEELSKKM